MSSDDNIYKRTLSCTKKIESILEDEFGAIGRGLHEKATSVERRIGASVVKRIRYLATRRNKLMHEDGYLINDIEEYEKVSNQISNDLFEIKEKEEVIKNTPSQSNVSEQYIISIFSVGILLLVVSYASYQHGINSRPPADKSFSSENSNADYIRSDDNKSIALNSIRNKKSDDKINHVENLVKKEDEIRKQIKDAESEIENVASSKQDLIAHYKELTHCRRQIENKENAVINDDIIKLSSPRLSFEKGAFDDLEANIYVQVENTTNTILANARLQAALFLNGNPEPVFVTKKDGGFSDKHLFLYFGERGLKPGEHKTSKINISSFAERNWMSPAVLNADTRQILLRVVRVSDGMHNTIAEEAQNIFSEIAATENSINKSELTLENLLNQLSNKKSQLSDIAKKIPEEGDKNTASLN